MILDGYSEAHELVSKFVRPREVPTLTGFAPLGDEGLDLGVGYLNASAFQVQVVGRQVGKTETEDLVELRCERGELGARDRLVS